ncbi:hypothetical protein [Nocardioides aquiterrae]|uniref:Helix-turn-helix domain-containing protein n=1 Tax=Nocardioides aquiterrae TaxID=203799 RepID=A0ABP4EX10_9ACTN
MSWEDQVVECPPTEETKRAIRAGLRRFNDAVREYGPSDDWDRAVIYAVIEAFAAQGQPFSINDCRDHLPPVRKALISRGFIRAQREGLIEWKGRTTPSTLESTNAAAVKVYVPVRDDSRPPVTPPAPRRKQVPPPVAVDDVDEPTLFELEAS